MTVDELHNLTTHVDGQTEVEFVTETGEPCAVVDFIANGSLRVVLWTPRPAPPPEVVHVPGEFIIGQFHAGNFT